MVPGGLEVLEERVSLSLKARVDGRDLQVINNTRHAVNLVANGT